MKIIRYNGKIIVLFNFIKYGFAVILYNCIFLPKFQFCPVNAEPVGFRNGFEVVDADTDIFIGFIEVFDQDPQNSRLINAFKPQQYQNLEWRIVTFVFKRGGR